MFRWIQRINHETIDRINYVFIAQIRYNQIIVYGRAALNLFLWLTLRVL